MNLFEDFIGDNAQRRLHHRQICRARTFENFADIDAAVAIAVGKVWSVADEAPAAGIFALRVNRRQQIAGGRRDESAPRLLKNGSLLTSMAPAPLLNGALAKAALTSSSVAAVRASAFTPRWLAAFCTSSACVP
jgi:hypothetical protein